MQKGQSREDSLNTSNPSSIQTRTVFIQRSDPHAKRSSSIFNNRASVGGSASFAPGVYREMSQTGVFDFKGSRQKEKKDLQDLNERFASYIEKVHYLQTKCKQLEAENEALRNRKTENLQPIKDRINNEVEQARKVIDELSIARGTSEAKIAGLQDEIASLRDIIATYENQAKDYRKKIDALNNQVGELEGELDGMRLRITSLEDETTKLRQLNDKLNDQNKALRADLENETIAHIEADCLAQTKTEECQFLKDIIDQFELLKQEPVLIKGMNDADFWKSEMSKCLRDINQVYDEKLLVLTDDMEAKYQAQINTLKTGNVKDNMQLNHALEEAKRLRGQLSDTKALLADWQAKCAALEAEKNELLRRAEELERQLEDEKLAHSREVEELSAELESVLSQLRALMDAKMSMEMEIACYEKLLQGEESRVGIRSLVEQTLNTQSRGGASLGDIIQQSTLQESTGSLTVQRTSKGILAFKGCDHAGRNITLENTSDPKKSKSQNIKNWRVQMQDASGKTLVDSVLGDYTIHGGQTYTIWSNEFKTGALKNNEMTVPRGNLLPGNCNWKLVDQNGEEKAALKATFQ